MLGGKGKGRHGGVSRAGATTWRPNNWPNSKHKGSLLQRWQAGFERHRATAFSTSRGGRGTTVGSRSTNGNSSSNVGKGAGRSSGGPGADNFFETSLSAHLSTRRAPVRGQRWAVSSVGARGRSPMRRTLPRTRQPHRWHQEAVASDYSYYSNSEDEEPSPMPQRPAARDERVAPAMSRRQAASVQTPLPQQRSDLPLPPVPLGQQQHAQSRPRKRSSFDDVHHPPHRSTGLRHASDRAKGLHHTIDRAGIGAAERDRSPASVEDRYQGMPMLAGRIARRSRTPHARNCGRRSPLPLPQGGPCTPTSGPHRRQNPTSTGLSNSPMGHGWKRRAWTSTPSPVSQAPRFHSHRQHASPAPIPDRSPDHWLSGKRAAVSPDDPPQHGSAHASDVPFPRRSVQFFESNPFAAEAQTHRRGCARSTGARSGSSDERGFPVGHRRVMGRQPSGVRRPSMGSRRSRSRSVSCEWPIHHQFSWRSMSFYEDNPFQKPKRFLSSRVQTPAGSSLCADGSAGSPQALQDGVQSEADSTLMLESRPAWSSPQA